MMNGKMAKTLLKSAKTGYSHVQTFLPKRRNPHTYLRARHQAICCAASASTNLLDMFQTEELQKCMVSNKEYYAPVLEEGDSFAESKEKFDAATSSQSPQELKGESDSSDGEQDAPSDSPAGKEFTGLCG